LYQFRETDQPDNFLIGCIFQEVAGGPILVQPSKRAAALQDFHELGFVNIIIPDVRQTFYRFHEVDYTLRRKFQPPGLMREFVGQDA
jgi:hypothetical protein